MKKRLRSALFLILAVLLAAGQAGASELLFSDTGNAYETHEEELLLFEAVSEGTEEEMQEETQESEEEILLFEDEALPVETAEGTCGENLRYRLTEDGTLILEGEGPMDDLGIASSLADPGRVTRVILPEGMTTIGNLAFQGFSGLTEIVLPQSVKSIGINAFMDCTALRSVVLPQGLETIDVGAFVRCRSLEEIVLPDTVHTLGMFCFYDCKAMVRASLSAGLGVVPYNAFGGCSRLAVVYLPEGIRLLNDQAFYNCWHLSDIRLPASLELIGSEVFYGCEALTGIEIPDGVRSIGLGAFESCTGLAAVRLPESLTFVDYMTFAFCESLQAIELPAGVKKIYGGAFDGCSSLEQVWLPDSLEAIDAYAFRSCSLLTAITIPPSVTEIGNDAFAGCSALSFLGYTGSMAEAYAQGYGIGFIPLEKKHQTLTAVRNYQKTVSEGSFKLQITSDGDGSLGITNFDPEVVSVSRNGKVVLRSPGIARIRIYAAEGITSQASEPVEITIRVLPDPVKVKGLKSLKSAKMTLKWKADPLADGYQIRYEKAGGSSPVKIRIANPARTSKTLSGLEGGAVYRVCIRAYKKDEGETLFGSWSQSLQIQTAL